MNSALQFHILSLYPLRHLKILFCGVCVWGEVNKIFFSFLNSFLQLLNFPSNVSSTAYIKNFQLFLFLLFASLIKNIRKVAIATNPNPNLLTFEIQTDLTIWARRLDQVGIKKNKCWLVGLPALSDHRIYIYERSGEIDKHDIVKELRKLHNKTDSFASCYWSTRNCSNGWMNFKSEAHPSNND